MALFTAVTAAGFCGQSEIMGRDERLMFDAVEEGVSKVLAMLRNPQRQATLREHFAERATRFGCYCFVCAIKLN